MLPEDSNFGGIYPMKKRKKEKLYMWWRNIVEQNERAPLPFSFSQAIKIKWQPVYPQTVLGKGYSRHQHLLMFESCFCR